MSIREMFSHLSNNALFAAVAGGLSVIAITALITTYVVSWRNADGQNLGNVETIEMADLQKALSDAKEKVKATGYVLVKVTPDQINDKITAFPKFTATIVMVNPLSKANCQRELDENNPRRNFEQILHRLSEFRQKSKSEIGQRLKVGVSNKYPTMTVLIIDHDLYAYFYPYNGLGTSSPVLKFRDYVKDERARFFENHLDSILKDATYLSKDDDYKPYGPDTKYPCESNQTK